MSDKLSLFQLARSILFLFTLGILINIANYCLYNGNTYTRVMFHEMYNSEKIDVAFIGSSNVYRHFDPEIWDKNLEMCTFNLGTSSQTPDDAYYTMKEVFNNQSPKYCVYGINSILFLDLDVYNNPIKSYIIFDYLKLSLNKCVYGYAAFRDKSLLNAWIPATRNANTDLVGLVKNITSVKRTENYKAYGYELYGTSTEDYKGRGFVYSYRQTEKGAVGRPSGEKFNEDKISDRYMFYIDKLKGLCDENNCELIFIVPPLPYASMKWQENYQVIQDFYFDTADKLGITIFNFDLSRPEYLLMEDSDFYDYGHMSGKGAEKFSWAASDLIKKYIDGEEIDREKYFYSSYEELLDNSPWVFNTWIEKIDGGYTAQSTYGNGVKPEYCFLWSEDEGETWRMLREYSADNRIDDSSIPNECNMLMVWTKPEGAFMNEIDYQQYDRIEL